MLDIETNLPLKVNEEGDAGPYLMVPLVQLEQVLRILKRGGVTRIISEDAIGLDDKPVIAIIDFSIGEDAARIQKILDAA